MKNLGPTFGNEVIAAGLGGLPFTWGNNSTQISAANLTPAQLAILDGVVAAHDPTANAPVADKVELVLLKIEFNHENRIRALEGKPAITLAQFKAAISVIAG